MDVSLVGTYRWAQRSGGRVNPQERAAIQKMLVESAASGAAEVSRDVRGGAARIDLDAVAIPDTAIAKAALEYAESLSPAYLIDHCYRTFYWGHLLAQFDGSTIADREAFFVASILHDLGCVEAHYQKDPRAHCFAVEGGFAAESLLTSKGFSPSRAKAVAEAIILHTNAWGVDDRHGTIAQYLYAGAACDVVGARSEEVPAATVDEVLKRHPCGDAVARFGEFLEREITERSDSRLAVISGLDGALPPLFFWSGWDSRTRT